MIAGSATNEARRGLTLGPAWRRNPHTGKRWQGCWFGLTTSTDPLVWFGWWPGGLVWVDAKAKGRKTWGAKTPWQAWRRFRIARGGAA